MPIDAGCHHPAHDEWRDERPDREEQVEEVQGPAAAIVNDGEDQAVHPAVDRAGAEPEQRCRQHEPRPCRSGTLEAEPRSEDDRGAAEDRPAPDALGQEAAGKGCRRVGQRDREVPQAE